jgi:hypothetical protein
MVANERKKKFPLSVPTTSCNIMLLVMKNKRTGISEKLVMKEEK